jgi:hypothetical protein
LIASSMRIRHVYGLLNSTLELVHALESVREHHV